jgi:hypothetical protein
MLMLVLVIDLPPFDHEQEHERDYEDDGAVSRRR